MDVNSILRGELIERVARHTPDDGRFATAIKGVLLIRASLPAQPLPDVCQPSLCVVVQGRKQASLAGEIYEYDALRHLVVSMTMPVVWQVIECSPTRPYLCIRIDIDIALIERLQARRGSGPAQEHASQRALFVARTDAPMLDAVARLVRLLDTPDDIAALSPLVLAEIHYRALTSEFGERLRWLCTTGTANRRVARAIDILKSRFAEPLNLRALATDVDMSRSSLHAHFKAATNLSPLQFQKQLRLQEARRLLLVSGMDASSASHHVGYESPSQFSRDYRRLFGAPPRREVALARGGIGQQGPGP